MSLSIGGLITRTIIRLTSTFWVFRRRLRRYHFATTPAFRSWRRRTGV